MEPRWLMECKRLPVGGRKRYKCCGTDFSAILFNDVDSWSMHCFRCKNPNNRVKKEFINMAVEVQPRKVKSVPADLICLSKVNPLIQQRVYEFIFSKGLTPEMLPEIFWSSSVSRFILRVEVNFWIGRDPQGYKQPKWVEYGKGSKCISVNAPKSIEKVVLVEDYLSACKVAYTSKTFGADTELVIALMGTALTSKCKAYLMKTGAEVICMLDDDKAGKDGAARIIKELSVLLDVSSFTHNGQDPKEMDTQVILDALYRGKYER